MFSNPLLRDRFLPNKVSWCNRGATGMPSQNGHFARGRSDEIVAFPRRLLPSFSWIVTCSTIGHLSCSTAPYERKPDEGSAHGKSGHG